MERRSGVRLSVDQPPLLGTLEYLRDPLARQLQTASNLRLIKASITHGDNLQRELICAQRVRLVLSFSSLTHAVHRKASETAMQGVLTDATFGSRIATTWR